MGGSGGVRPWRPRAVRAVLRSRLVVLPAAVGLVGALTGLSTTGGSQGLRAASVQSVVFTVALPGVTVNGQPGAYSSIQQAVAAEDQAYAAETAGQTVDYYILVAPGDYKTADAPYSSTVGNGWSQPNQGAQAPGPPASVLITTPNTWLIGLNRNATIVDGTHQGPPCSTDKKDQSFGPLVPVTTSSGTSTVPAGLNGIMVWQASNVWVENLTACNFLGGPGVDGATGNEIWWNGGADSGSVFHDTNRYWGEYLNATSTYFADEASAAQYGIFSSNWSGGVWDQTYASNFNDSGYYIGACQNLCDQDVDHAWSEFNALGYSGSNSGGWLWIHDSVFDNNADGFDTNSQNGDNPPPQDGKCNPNDPNIGYRQAPPAQDVPKGICWVFSDNVSKDNNDPNVPTAGSAAAGPVGTGLSLSGARDDAIVHNSFVDNGAWGTILVPYPDSGDPCTSGTLLAPDQPNTPASGQVCWFDEYGDALVGNTYLNNGGFGNPTNGDIAAVNLEPGPTDCFSGNSDVGGLTTSPPEAQLLYPTCNETTVPPDANAVFADEVACDSNTISLALGLTGGNLCPPGANYPRQDPSKIVPQPLPGAQAGTYSGPGPYQGPVSAQENPPSASLLPSEPDPCGDVPPNPWSGPAGCG